MRYPLQSMKPFSKPKVVVALAAGVLTALVASTLTTGTASHLWFAASCALLATLLSASFVMTLKSHRVSQLISATHRLSMWLEKGQRPYDQSAGVGEPTPRRRFSDWWGCYPKEWGGSTNCYSCSTRIFHRYGEWYAAHHDGWVPAFLCAGKQFKAPHSPVATDPLARLAERYA